MGPGDAMKYEYHDAAGALSLVRDAIL